MASGTTNVANIKQNFMNNVTQQSQQNCIATVNSSTNNNVVIVNGANIRGNFTGVATTTSTDATCLMVSSMEDSISNIISATLRQTNTSQTDWFNGFQFTADTNTFNISQSVTNNINQINQATCAANTTTSSNNNYIYVSNTVVGGDFVGVTSSANASADCTISNTMKNTTYNQAQADTSQSNTIQGMFVAMVAAFAGIIGVIVIGVIILFAVGAIGYVGYETVGGKSNPNQDYVSSLGLTQSELQLLYQ